VSDLLTVHTTSVIILSGKEFSNGDGRKFALHCI